MGKALNLLTASPGGGWGHSLWVRPPLCEDCVWTALGALCRSPSLSRKVTMPFTSTSARASSRGAEMRDLLTPEIKSWRLTRCKGGSLLQSLGHTRWPWHLPLTVHRRGAKCFVLLTAFNSHNHLRKFLHLSVHFIPVSQRRNISERLGNVHKSTQHTAGCFREGTQQGGYKSGDAGAGVEVHIPALACIDCISLGIYLVTCTSVFFSVKRDGHASRHATLWEL